MKTKIIKEISTPVLTFLVLIILGATIITAAPGDLDPTFSSDGKLTDLIPGTTYNVFVATVVQPDGKIVAVGNDSGLRPYFYVARYNADGSPDKTFGGTGKVAVQFGPWGGNYVSDVAIQPDGKIVAAGCYCQDYKGPPDLALARLNSDGSLDGILLPHIGSQANSIAIQADGKIVVAGQAGDWLVIRLNSDGSQDSTFLVNGNVFAPNHAAPYSVAIQTDGKIVAAGSSVYTGSPGDFAVVRYNTNGSLDTTFDGDGIVTTPVDPGLDEVRSIAIQTDGKIVAAGPTNWVGPDNDFAVVRYNANGSLDTTFDNDGIVITPIGTGMDGASAVAIQSDGKIVAAGYSYDGSNNDFALARYNPNGSLDTTFGGGDGKTTADFDASNDIASGMAFDSAGRAVVVGRSADKFAIARFLLAPTLRSNGKIAFTSDRDGNREVYVMNPDGTNQVRLTNNNIVDDHPTWSPDGRKIAFLSQRDSGEFAIFVMNPDGTGKTEIAPVNYLSGQFNWSMSWAPDGSRIVFSEVISNINILVIVNADGSGRRSLTPGRHPAWSPDGSEILFSTGTLFDNPLYTIRPDGTGLHPFGPWGFSPTWSPDGLRIAFDDNDSAVGYIYTTGPNGVQIFAGPCHPAAIPDGCGGPVRPAWSPDGRMIAFQYDQIYTKSLGGGESVQLTTVGSNSNPNWQPIVSRRVTIDFDGDGRADILVFRPSDRTWYLNRSTQGFIATQFGLSTDKITPADFDGDGKTDIAVFRDGTWYWLGSLNGSFNAFQFGTTGDVPVPADFTGDGRSELAIYRSGVWWMIDLSNNQVNAIQFGLSTDKTVVADYDGDGRADQAVYRGNGEWHLNRSSQGYAAVNFGLSTDRPVGGDYDGDGRADQAVYRDGTWYLLQSTQGFAAFQFGIASDIPAPADYDGDGKTDLAVYRAGTWYLLQSTSGFSAQQFGLANDKPVPAAYVP